MSHRLTTVPTPRYQIGQTVFAAGLTDGKEELPCPDCLGQRQWAVRSPAGYETQVSCPRCGGVGALALRAYAPTVNRLTIGTVRIDTHTHAGSNEDHVSYMAEETGIGSGTLWRESQLYGTHAEAEAAAAIRAREATKALDDGPYRKARNQFRDLAEHQLKDADMKAAEERASEAERRITRLQERVCDLLDTSWLYVEEGLFNGDENRPSDTPHHGNLDLTPQKRHMLVEHLMSGYGSEENQKFLVEYREEKARCKCD